MKSVRTPKSCWNGYWWHVRIQGDGDGAFVFVKASTSLDGPAAEESKLLLPRMKVGLSGGAGRNLCVVGWYSLLLTVLTCCPHCCLWMQVCCKIQLGTAGVPAAGLVERNSGPAGFTFVPMSGIGQGRRTLKIDGAPITWDAIWAEGSPFLCNGALPVCLELSHPAS